MTVGALLIVELVHFGFRAPAPLGTTALLLSLVAVSHATFRAGLASGVLSAALIAAYTLRFVSPSGITPASLQGALIMLVIGLAMAVAVRALERRSARAARELIQQEREHARSLAASNLALREANETLEAFAFVVSHDLKEPVRAIEAYLRALDEDHARELAPDAKALLANARASTDRLASLMGGLLDLSRVTRGELDLEPVSVAEVLESASCRASYERLLVERGGKIELKDGESRVLASRGLLSQILGNVVNNALRHNPREAPLVRVSSRAAAGDAVEILVEDDGPGFPKHLLGRADDLHAVPPSGRGGFGLIIARRGVERLGGRFEIAQSNGGGGAVRITLKAAPREGWLTAAKSELA